MCSCPLLARVFTELEVSETYTHLIDSFIVLGMLLSFYGLQSIGLEFRLTGFIGGYGLMVYGLENAE